MMCLEFVDHLLNKTSLEGRRGSLTHTALALLMEGLDSFVMAGPSFSSHYLLREWLEQHFPCSVMGPSTHEFYNVIVDHLDESDVVSNCWMLNKVLSRHTMNLSAFCLLLLSLINPCTWPLEVSSSAQKSSENPKSSSFTLTRGD